MIVHFQTSKIKVNDDLTDIKAWIAGVQGRDSDNARLNHPRLSLFSSHYGPLANELSLKQCQDTVQAIIDDNHLYNDWAKSIDADLRLFELSRGDRSLTFTSDIRAHAVSFGMMVAEQGLDMHAIRTVSVGYESDYEAALSITNKEQALDFLLNKAGDDICAMVGTILASGLGQIPVFILSLIHI